MSQSSAATQEQPHVRCGSRKGHGQKECGCGADLVVGRENVVRKLNLSDCSDAIAGQPNCKTENALFGQGCVEDAIGTWLKGREDLWKKMENLRYYNKKNWV